MTKYNRIDIYLLFRFIPSIFVIIPIKDSNNGQFNSLQNYCYKGSHFSSTLDKWAQSD